MRVALIGYGYWGINLARTISKNSNFELYSIFDADRVRVDEAKKLYSFKEFSSLDELLKSDVEAIFVATPPHTHYNVAKQALLSKKHIFVEKPFTTSLTHTYELLDLADKMNLYVFVDHVFIYSEPVKYLKENLDSFGDIVYINSRRINLGLFQYTTDVMWDLAVHDLSIIEHLVGLDIKRTSVFKKKYKDFPNEALANIELELNSGIVIGINVSWLSPVKVREMIIGGTKKVAFYDDTIADKIKLYDSGVVLEKSLDKNELYNYMVQYKYGDVFTPELPSNQSLDNSVEAFFNSIKHKTEPLTGKESIINVIKTLELISKI
jgi:predicted dehydrogenase